ncbi:MAG: DUF4248 domain-containing protein [Bacteroidaceae bacterium]|nr:DUF4248 domain-containing protein [Bacteroidaceae bacterium]
MQQEKEEIREWTVKPMSKAEIAAAYAPYLTTHAAVNRMMEWIRRNTELTDLLNRSGYRKTQKLFTSYQVRLIFEYLGEP